MKIRTLLLPAVLLILVLAGFTFSDRSAEEARPDQAPQAIAEVASWSVDAVHSKIGFKVKHLGISNVRGNFKDYDVAISLDPSDFNTLETTATIKTTSVFTDNERRDNHLRSPDFFAAETFPNMTFVSKGVRNINGSEFEIVGDLTIRDVTKEVVLEAEFLGAATMGDQERAGFEATTTINRLDYGLAWNKVTEAGGFVVGHDVQIILELEVIKDAS